MVGDRPVLFEAWSGVCLRLGLVPARPGDGHRPNDVAVVLFDTDTRAGAHFDGPIVLLLDHPSVQQLVAQPMGVNAVITWADREFELEAATRAVLDGGWYISPTAAPAVLGALAATSTSSRVLPDRLTAREIDVLRALVDGATIGATARALGIAVKTVEAHRASAFVKLGVRTQAQAIAQLVSDPTILGRFGQ
jgi:DNA-binding NarL/FixJ family response regulator